MGFNPTQGESFGIKEDLSLGEENAKEKEGRNVEGEKLGLEEKVKCMTVEEYEAVCESKDHVKVMMTSGFLCFLLWKTLITKTEYRRLRNRHIRTWQWLW